MFSATRSHVLPLSVGFTFVLLLAFALMPVWRFDNEPRTDVTSSAAAKLENNFAQLPLSFEPNQGQAADDVRFQSYGANYALHLMNDAVALQVRQSEKASANIKLKWLGANAQPVLRGERKLPGMSHYLRGNDETKWQRDVPNYAAARYEQLYPGIDVVFYGQQQQLEYDFVVAPGADPAMIQFTVEGTQAVRLDANGDLLMQTATDTLRQQKPVIYQNDASERREVKGGYRLQGNTVAFEVDAYDRTLPLVIDPVVVFTARVRIGKGLAVDAQGNAYLASDLLDQNLSQDVLVRKINADGTAILYSTVVGGSSIEASEDIALDGQGNVYITGGTTSTDLPMGTTPNSSPLGQSGAGFLFKTTDNGTTWKESARGVKLGASGAILEVVFDPTNPQVVYASGQSNAFYKSTDGGQTWQGFPQFPQSFHPLVVNKSGHLFGNVVDKLYRSTDGGIATELIGSFNNTILRAMVIDPSNANTMYVGGGSMIYKTTNGGVNWTLMNKGIVRQPSYDTQGGLRLAISPSNPATLYALVDGGESTKVELFRSTDGGANWSVIVSFSDKALRNFAVDFINSVIYLGTSQGVFKTLDEGKTFSPVGLSNANISALLTDPTNGSRLYAVVSGFFNPATPTQVMTTIWRSTNSGATWQSVEGRLRPLSFSTLALSPSGNGTLFFGTRYYYETFVSKLNPNGQLVYSAYCGEGTGLSIAVDGSGSAYVTGSSNFAGSVPRVPYNGFLAEPSNGFLHKLNAAGDQMLYSSNLYGIGGDVAVDAAGNVAVMGNAYIPAPMKNGFKTTGDGSSDAFVALMDTRKTGDASLLYSSLFGGKGLEIGQAVAFDSTGKLYLMGKTDALGEIPNRAIGSLGRGSLFLAKFDPTKAGVASLVWSGLFGENDNVTGKIAVDRSGAVWLSGAVKGFAPTTPGALQTTNSGGAGGNCGFIITCTPGCTRCPSPGFPQCQSGSIPVSCSDAFITKVASDGSAMLYSTYFGATDVNDVPYALALDSTGNLYLSGIGSPPVTVGALNQPNVNSEFLAKFSFGTRSGAVAAVSAASYAASELAPASLAAAFLDASGAGVESMSITITDSAGNERDARVLYSGTGQVNFEIPAGTAAGLGQIKVKYRDTVVASGSIRIASIAPGIFAFSGTGRGVAAALALRVKADGTQVYESLARYDQTLRQWVAVPVDLGPATDQVYLVLFGTGFRNVNNLSRVQLTVGGQAAEVLYAGEQPTLIGVDQINALLPRTLIGRGEVDVATTIDGKAANVVRVAIK